jgi:hypothetical protein
MREVREAFHAVSSCMLKLSTTVKNAYLVIIQEIKNTNIESLKIHMGHKHMVGKISFKIIDSCHSYYQLSTAVNNTKTALTLIFFKLKSTPHLKNTRGRT